MTEQERSDRSRRRASAGRRQTSERPPAGKRSPHRNDPQGRKTGDPAHHSPAAPRPGLSRRDNEPPVPEGVDTRSLHASVRAELRGLPKDLAEIVAAYLVVAGRLVDEDTDFTRMPKRPGGELRGCRSSGRRQPRRRTPLVDMTLRSANSGHSGG